MFGSFAVIILVLLCLFSPIFSVSDVKVTGARILSPYDVIKASGIEKGDNFFFINSKKSAKAIENLGYVDSVNIKRKFFTRIEIEVIEVTEIAYIAFSGNYVGIDENCKVLSIEKSNNLVPKKAVISGFGIKNVKKGEKVKPKDEKKREAVVGLLELLKEKNLLDKTMKIDVTDLKNISFTLTSEVKILLGDSKDLDYKTEYAKVVLESQSNMKSGTLDIRDTSNVIYHPQEGGKKNEGKTKE